MRALRHPSATRPTRPTRRRAGRSALVLGAAVSVGASLLGGCGGGPHDLAGLVAARVGDVELSYADARELARAEGALAGPVAGNDSTHALAATVDRWVRQELYRQWGEAEGIEPTEGHIAEATALIGTAIADPAALEREISAAAVRLAALDQTVRGEFATIAPNLESTCVNQLVTVDNELIFTDPNYVPAPEEHEAALGRMQDVVDQLDDGADFADLVQSASEDELSREAGGDGGCVPTSTITDLALAERLAVLEPGDVDTEPIDLGYAWLLLQLRERVVPTIDEVLASTEQGGLLETARGAAAAVLDAQLLEIVDNLVIRVDPRIGTWDADNLFVIAPSPPSAAPAAPSDQLGAIDLSQLDPATLDELSGS